MGGGGRRDAKARTVPGYGTAISDDLTEVRAAREEEIVALLGARPGSLGAVGVAGQTIIADEQLRGRTRMTSTAATPRLTVEAPPSDALARRLLDGLAADDPADVGRRDHRPFAVALHDAGGTLIGGVLAATMWRCSGGVIERQNIRAWL